ncbi:hypothetical protein AVEN_247960-1 [Araneus ventricosus]|uniref:Uncharacterized protein n=1 Tax=Araneus ventricosus TaxID=182803 RepID=A0A4Y2CI31_ARAVE|nr:hypothetical protein AVEN_247960-1 [Araneus ventricosus]
MHTYIDSSLVFHFPPHEHSIFNSRYISFPFCGALQEQRITNYSPQTASPLLTDCPILSHPAHSSGVTNHFGLSDTTGNVIAEDVVSHLPLPSAFAVYKSVYATACHRFRLGRREGVSIFLVHPLGNPLPHPAPCGRCSIGMSSSRVRCHRHPSHQHVCVSLAITHGA